MADSGRLARRMTFPFVVTFLPPVLGPYFPDQLALLDQRPEESAKPHHQLHSVPMSGVISSNLMPYSMKYSLPSRVEFTPLHLVRQTQHHSRQLDTLPTGTKEICEERQDGAAHYSGVA